jgi:kynurenine formamidase
MRSRLVSAMVMLAAGTAFAQQAAAPAKKTPAKIGSPGAPEETLSRSKNPLLRESAAQVLGLRGSPESVPLLTRALAKDDNLWVRGRSAEALGLIGSPSGIPGLSTALGIEKDPRVRRMIGQALVRLGQPAGVKELMWQLRSGTNYVKAEVMQFLVGITGQPFGQEVDAWWAYLHEEGRLFLARRPGGSPTVVEMHGVSLRGVSLTQGPFLFAKAAPSFRQVPAVVLTLEPTAYPVSRQILALQEKRSGKIPDGCLLLIRTRWKEAAPAPPAPPSAPAPARQPGAPMSSREPSPGGQQLAPPVRGPFLEPEATRFLLERAPKLIGVAIDAPSLDPPGSDHHPSRTLLVSQGKLAIESLDDMDRVVPLGTRVLLVRQGAKGKDGSYPVKLLAVLP